MRFASVNALHLQHPGRKALALHPLLGKGGMHTEERKAVRHRKDRHATRQQLRHSSLSHSHGD